ncbi:hypothetical protein DRQ36_08805, partial [bacterium]
DEIENAEEELVARRILSAVKGDIESKGILQVAEGNGTRPAEWGDIAILYPSRTDFLEPLRKALLARNIPYIIIGGKGFYSTEEVRAALDLLFYLDDPRDRLALFGLLRGPLFALPDTVIFAASIAGEKDIREGLRLLVESPDCPEIRDLLTEAELALARDCLNSLSELENLKENIPPSVLLSHAFENRGAWATFSGMLNGTQRVANIEKLIGICSTHDSRGLRTLVKYLRAVIESVEAEREAAIELYGTDAVRLMTVHQAKGLEFPIVIVANLSKGSSSSSKSAFRWDILTGPYICAREANIQEKGRYHELINGISKERNDAETRRILYVATTRAQDHLILSGKSPKKSYMALVSDAIGLEEPEDGCKCFELNTGKEIIPVTVSTGLNSWPVSPQEKHPGNKVFTAILDGLEIPGEAPVDSNSITCTEGLWHIRATDLPRLTDCPRKGIFEEIIGAESIDGSLGPEWGTVVHRFFERLPSPLPESRVVKEIAEKTISESNFGQNRVKELGTLLDSEIIRSVFDLEIIESRKEERIVFDAGELMITGIIDRLWKDEEGWHIIDYKTDAVVGPERDRKLNYYAPQIAVYRRAVALALGLPESSITASVLFTHTPAEILPIPDIDLDSILSKVKAVLRGEPLEVNYTLCGSCVFNEFCEKS